MYSREDHTLRNLEAFAKLYGYIRYFHPSDEASEIDWDSFAVYGAHEVRDAADASDLRSILDRLFLPIAPTIQIYSAGENPAPVDFPRDTADLKIVAWQHLGVGSSGPYTSIRTNCENKIDIGGYGFGTISQSVTAEGLHGRRIRLAASVRSSGRAQLWLRVDRTNEQRGFFDNMDDRPIHTTEWQKYEIIGPVANDAKSIVFGCFLLGKGEAWVDDVTLSVQSNGGWEQIEISNPAFDREKDGKPVGWYAESARYTFRLVDDNPVRGETCLLIAAKREVQIVTEPQFDAMPEAGELIRKNLGAGLTVQFPIALYRDDNGTLGGSGDRHEMDALIDQLAATKENFIGTDQEAVRLGGIAIAWNIFQHFYPYFDVVNTNWDAALTDALSAAITDERPTEYLKTVHSLIEKLHDGHAGASGAGQSKRSDLGFIVDWIENEIVVTFAPENSPMRPGDIIVSVNGEPARHVLAEEEARISGSPQHKRCNGLKQFAWDKPGSVARLVARRRAEQLEIEVERSQVPLPEAPKGANIEELENGIFYVDISRTPMAVIDERIDELAGATGVAFDLRGYPNNNHEIICHLLTEADTSGGWMKVPRVIFPDRERPAGFKEFGWYLKPKEPHFEGKIVFLTDANAISYAESFLGFIEGYKLAEIVGQPTAGTNGNVNTFTLPGGIQVRWTGMKVVKHDGSQHHLIGILPTVPATRTIQGVREGHDEFLEMALKIIRS